MYQKIRLLVGFERRPPTPAAFHRLVIIGLVGLAVALLSAALPVHAATIIVDTTADDLTNNGNCTLREAIIAANTDTAVDGCNAGNGSDIIILDVGTYEVSVAGGSENAAQTGDLDITEDLYLNGDGRAVTFIDGNGLDRVFEIIAADVEMNAVTITGGDEPASSGGGVAVNGGSLTLINSRVEKNKDSGLFVGSNGTLTLNFTYVNDNEGSTYGGGIYVFIGSLLMTNSTVEENTAGGAAGIRVATDGTALIANSTISGNVANSSFSGGGIEGSGTLTMVNSTISGNSSKRYGGGLLVGSGATTNLHNITIANNTADSDGDNVGDGGGIHIASGIVNFQNTMMAGNFDQSSGTVYPDCSGTLESLGYNLVHKLDGCTISGSATGNKMGANPKLEPLSNNGGTTMTHMLPVGSPAIDGGNPKGCFDNKNPLTIDQRGYARPIDGNGDREPVCDIGAVEFLSPGTPTPTATSTATATALATATAIASPTATVTPLPTDTATPGPSPTATNTATPGPSPTATPSATATDGPSPTATETAFPTETATLGPSPTATETATPGPSPTATTPFVPGYWVYLPVNPDD